MMINFGNRYTALVSLIRDLLDTVVHDHTLSGDMRRFLRKIRAMLVSLLLIDIVWKISVLTFFVACGEGNHLCGHKPINR